MFVQKSFNLRPKEKVAKWHEIDASNKVVGRLATEIAMILRGKKLPTFTPNQDSGDYVIVTNCEKVRFSGKKWDDKVYYWHTNHIGGLKSRTATEQRERHPEKILFEAVKGMLPKNSMGRKQLTKLKLFVGPEHNMAAQKPEKYEIKG